MKGILVTGANGFVGRNLCGALFKKGFHVRAAVRDATRGNFVETLRGFGVDPSPHSPKKEEGSIEVKSVGEIGPNTPWEDAISGMDAVVHLGARVHILREDTSDPLPVFMKVNAEGTERLGDLAARMGVKRLVFLSSIGVNGQKTGNRPFTPQDPPAPFNPYSLSKWKAEEALWKISEGSKMEVVVIRSPMVYGPENPGNFLRLLHLLKGSLPLPLGSVKNYRSMIYIGNLVDALITCLFHPRAGKKTFLVCDGEGLSTPELIRRVRGEMGKRGCLIPFPTRLLHLTGVLLGRPREMDSLVQSLQVDGGAIRETLGWTPPFTLEEGIRKTVEWYVSSQKNG